jgi:hypothetical protein
VRQDKKGVKRTQKVRSNETIEYSPFASLLKNIRIVRSGWTRRKNRGRRARKLAKRNREFVAYAPHEGLQCKDG